MWVRDSFSSDEKKTIDVPTIVNQVVSLFVNSIILKLLSNVIILNEFSSI
jgi:hypothetical protein